MAALVSLTLECDREGCGTRDTFLVECHARPWVQYSKLGCAHDPEAEHEEAEDEGMLVFCSDDCLMFHLAKFPEA